MVAQRLKKQICVLGSKEQVIHLLKECSGKYLASEIKHIPRTFKGLENIEICWLKSISFSNTTFSEIKWILPHQENEKEFIEYYKY